MAVDSKRSETMRRIKSKDTSIEVSLRKALWHTGIRYRKNFAKLPGSPDIAITKHRIAIFCDGEFWHGKDWDLQGHRIHNNQAYWVEKIERNMLRDTQTDRALASLDWTVIRFWGGEIQKNLNRCVEEVQDAIWQKEMEKAFVEKGQDSP